MKKKTNKNKRRSEESGYVIVENIIVMPVVFLVLFALIFAGCVLHAKCTIESAARRGVIYATKLVCDPQYEKITEKATDVAKGELNELAAAEFDFTRIEHYQPYRYFSFSHGANSRLTQVENTTKNYVNKIIDQSVTWMFTIDTDSIECEAKNYVISQKIRVKVTATYHTPKIFSYLGIPETYELNSEAVTSVSDQDEFIRNVDFMHDLLDELGVLDFIHDKMEKMTGFIKKIFGS